MPSDEYSAGGIFMLGFCSRNSAFLLLSLLNVSNSYIQTSDDILETKIIKLVARNSGFERDAFQTINLTRDDCKVIVVFQIKAKIALIIFDHIFDHDEPFVRDDGHTVGL